MDYLGKGKYYGVPNKKLQLNGLIITDNEYIYDSVDWHYHENAYFTYMLSGGLEETSRKNSFTCLPGSLLFHNSQEPHYNVKHPGFAQGFQVEIENSWFKLHDVNFAQTEGVLYTDNILTRNLFNKLYAESKILDSCSEITIDSLILKIFSRIFHIESTQRRKIPNWVDKVCGILNDNFSQTVSLNELSAETGIHPVHISAEFSKYINCTIGEYLRQCRAEKAFNMLKDNSLSLTEISSICGFADQSHFIRVFKSIYGVVPSHYRKKIS